MKYQFKPFQMKELDMLPYMNLFSILIPFLIAVTSFQHIGLVPVDLPPASDDADSYVPPAGTSLDLSVLLTDTQLQVWSSQGALAPIPIEEQWTIRCQGDKEPNAPKAPPPSRNISHLKCQDGSIARNKDLEEIALLVNGTHQNAYEVLGQQLKDLAARVSDAPDGDHISVVANDSMAFDKIIHVMDAARDNGFPRISLAKLGG